MIVGIILAAGDSLRMGLPKALLAFTHEPRATSFLARLVDLFHAAGVARVLVVTGSTHDRVCRHVQHAGLRAEVVRNPDPAAGQLSSLQCALRALDIEPSAATGAAVVDAVLVTTVDAPLVRLDTITRLIATFRETGAPVVRPAAPGDRHGHPVVFSRALCGRLLRADAAAGAKPVVRALGQAIVDEWVNDPGAFLDLDTPEEYRRALGRDPSVVDDE